MEEPLPSFRVKRLDFALVGVLAIKHQVDAFSQTLADAANLIGSHLNFQRDLDEFANEVRTEIETIYEVSDEEPE